MLTPYRGNLECLQTIRRPELVETLMSKRLESTRPIPFRVAKPTYVVILVLGVNVNSGLRFVANKDLICIVTNRHVGSLFVVGYIDTVPEVMTGVEKKKASLQTSDDLESESIKAEDPLGWWPWDLNDPETWMGEFDPHYDSYSVSISTPQYEESTGYYVEASTQTENAINNVDSSYQPEGNSDENPWYAEDAAPMDLDNDIWW
ncbi:hypothetical protein HYE67_008945 [Fusarium culmorum]|uniref:Uncharacterized protein n=1 Tax=Fusarium culmorum TaxID=5516 RepID=A0A7S8HZZ4_FUSCU|nr:hypothetical protein HYE67_008945 [Fusarium culmorum]